MEITILIMQDKVLFETTENGNTSLDNSPIPAWDVVEKCVVFIIILC